MNDNIFDLVLFVDLVECVSVEKVLVYMGLKLGILLIEVVIDKVFIGFCINSCIEDLCVVVEIVKG